MDTIEISVSTDEDNSIILNFSTDDKLKIKTNEDIDLTEYVAKLTTFINKKQKLIFTKKTFEDPKFNLIQDTIEKIAKSFNDSITSDETITDDSV